MVRVYMVIQYLTEGGMTVCWPVINTFATLIVAPLYSKPTGFTLPKLHTNGF